MNHRERPKAVDRPLPPVAPQPEPASVMDIPLPTAASTGAIHHVELVISRLLRFGVFGSLTLLIVGTLLSFHHGRYGHTPEDVQRLIGGGEPGPQTTGAFLHGLTDWRGQAFVVAGLLLLIATPIVRVAVSVVTFAIERDWIFAIITAIVLALLVLSFVTGKVGG